MKFHDERFSKLVREQLSEGMAREIETPGAVATVTAIIFSGEKNELAEVKTAIFPSEKADQTIKDLNRQAPVLQTYLFRKLHVRSIPKLVFTRDYGNENAASVEKAFIKVEEQESGEGI